MIIVCLMISSIAYLAHAQPQRTGSTKQMWEYQTLRASGLDLTSPEVKKAMSDAGNSGWELVAITNESTVSVSLYWLTFKRPK